MEAARKARVAIADVAASLAALHNRAVFISARARHTGSVALHVQLLRECDDIEQAIRSARAELILRLMDATEKVAGHSRVVDVERSLDSLERALVDARKALREH